MGERVLHLLSGGAAQGLVRALQPAFEQQHGCWIDGTFGAVVAMKEKLLGGTPCDLLILTHALISELAGQGRAVDSTARPIGLVKTGVAVKDGAADADVSSPEKLKAVLEGAAGIYFPDPAKATAGIHFQQVLDALGIATRRHTFPNGAAAMAELAKAADPSAVGCTQITEILITPGVRLAGLLPPPYALATTYTGAVCTQAIEAALAAQLLAALVSAQAAETRRQCGME